MESSVGFLYLSVCAFGSAKNLKKDRVSESMVLLEDEEGSTADNAT